jgi:hypothetical protein
MILQNTQTLDLSGSEVLKAKNESFVYYLPF